MLQIAFLYQEQLQRLFPKTIYNEKYKYYHCYWYVEYAEEIKKDSWETMQFVSVDSKDNVIGYIEAKIDRKINAITSLRIINFSTESIVFSRDVKHFFDDLLNKYRFRKVTWAVVVGNPAEKIYDRYIKRYGGRIVGIHKDDVRLWDGKYYDFKFYEVMNPEIDRH